ncbi:hypothetical protein GRF29_185g1403257 [Pseudopithomyces chartarum]|uniref:Pirin N-terminal domain-containing protein n=1 Tax=Pseudopithomyces chartarum TaxID=1892770 RepID=A0AAN6LNF6_9PLEO|nr:hypothetical protein GRF29_185g1403257 [Pseudopithomyces chartarum]
MTSKHQQQQQSTTTTTATPSPTPTYPLLTTKTLATLIALLSLILALSSPLRTTLSSLLPKSTRALSTFSPSTMKITPRPWSARGHADHNWLYTYHTFNFASYYSPHPLHSSFGPLRVINEDRVKPTTGFGTHSHAEFLIFSYIVSGTLEHRDSMGNLEYLRRGEVQFTSAGTGIRHSEYNRDEGEEVHFLQIWAKPDKRGLKPHYETKRFTDEEKENKLVRIMEYTERMKEGKQGPIALQADLSMSASILAPGKEVVHEVVAEGPRKIFLQVIMGGGSSLRMGVRRLRLGMWCWGREMGLMWRG